MTNLAYNRYNWVEIASVAYQAEDYYQAHVNEFVVFKNEDNGSFAYLETGHCSCCGSDYRGYTLTAMDLGQFILSARKWAREVANDSDRENLTGRVKKMIDKVIDYVDGDREEKIKAARQKTQQIRENMKELEKLRMSFNAAMTAKFDKARAELNKAYEELNKLTD